MKHDPGNQGIGNLAGTVAHSLIMQRLMQGHLWHLGQLGVLVEGDERVSIGDAPDSQGDGSMPLASRRRRLGL
ncbi:hypothetical protein [Paucibacter soli]|uniref:hypothetical protein n=1 Tax=Paucibacter soli TaxID=3133433 RepID=UPI0030B759AC